MPARTVTPIRTRRGPLRSPLAVAAQSPPPSPAKTGADRATSRPAVSEPRAVTVEEFADYLRTVTNRDGRPYEETTIGAYVYPAKALDAWLTSQGYDGDFTNMDTAILNRYFRDYFQAHGQGGTH